jgi:hypothetical protein
MARLHFGEDFTRAVGGTVVYTQKFEVERHSQHTSNDFV